ncbi:MacS family sensor histidine kinase [Nocardioides kongjuensis]|uniref:MacS family sensor histidine kinase n=1 Tax=Nocardioides kongjuensis TaxID=349522 RepID=UPI0015C8809D
MAAGAVTTRAALAVEDRMFRALAVLRVVVLGYTVVLNAYRNNFDHPVLGWVCVAVMVVATAVAILVYAAPERRVPAVLLVDLALAVALLLATPVVKGPWFQATIPGYWIVGALLAWAVRYGWRGGTIAAVLLGAVDLLTRSHVAQKDWGNVFLILLGGSMVGFVCESLKAMAAERDLAQREAAAAQERARLARAVHDGVLQVLALVQRQGGELGRAAGAQERALRTLIRSQDALSATPQALAGHADLARALGVLGARPGTEVGLPAGVVELPAHTVTELAAVVRACLDNIERHVGPDARAWVLVEDLGDRVEVSVRDEGPGIAEGRLEAAEQEGRLGVVESIRGRVADLGGTATLDTGAHGTEWTFVVPRRQERS